MAYSNDTKPSSTYTLDDEPTFPSGSPIGMLLSLTFSAETGNAYTNDSKPS